jgi:hypothetical protein
MMTAAFLSMTAMVAYAAPHPVKDVKVEADLSALKNAEAAKYWTNLPGDLQNAIVTRLAGNLDSENGSVAIRVTVDTVTLATAWPSPAADSVLSGHVVETDDKGGGGGRVYDLKITMDQAKVFLPQSMAVATVATDSKEYYDSVVQAFADEVVKDYMR